MIFGCNWEVVETWPSEFEHSKTSTHATFTGPIMDVLNYLYLGGMQNERI